MADPNATSWRKVKPTVRLQVKNEYVPYPLEYRSEGNLLRLRWKFESEGAQLGYIVNHVIDEYGRPKYKNG